MAKSFEGNEPCVMNNEFHFNVSTIALPGPKGIKERG